MNLRQLEYVQSICKEGSITKAAAKQYISQSAMSQHLIRLEEELGAPIFERGFSPLRLTYFGEEFMKYAQKILFDCNEVLHLYEEMEHTKKSRLTIGIPTNRSIQILPDILQIFSDKYPNIELNFQEHPSSQLDAMIIQGEIDCSIMLPASQNPLITFSPIIREELFLAVSQNSHLCNLPTTSRGYLNLEDCANEPFIIVKKGSRHHQQALNLFRQHNITPNIRTSTGNIILAGKLAATGYGICLISQLPAILNMVQPAPVYYKIGETGVYWTLGLNYHRDKYISWDLQLFQNCLRDALKKHLPDNIIQE